MNTSYDPDQDPKDNRVERLLDEADYRRDERKDREMEELWAKSQIPTPEADACYHHCVTHSGPGSGLVMCEKMRDLERRLTVAREALEQIAKEKPIEQGCYYSNKRSIAKAAEALTATAPKP